MTTECERIEQWLDREESPALPADLEAHAASCDLCRLRLAIARDLGERLGCGAHISALRRLWVEPFREPAMVTLDQLRAMVEAGDEAGMDALLLPLAAGLAEYPRVDLDADQAHRFCVGQRQRDLSWPRGLVAVFGPDDAVQGLGQVDESGLLAPQRRFNL